MRKSGWWPPLSAYFVSIFILSSGVVSLCHVLGFFIAFGMRILALETCVGGVDTDFRAERLGRAADMQFDCGRIWRGLSEIQRRL